MHDSPLSKSTIKPSNILSLRKMVSSLKFRGDEILWWLTRQKKFSIEEIYKYLIMLQIQIFSFRNFFRSICWCLLNLGTCQKSRVTFGEYFSKWYWKNWDFLWRKENCPGKSSDGSKNSQVWSDWSQGKTSKFSFF